ncbi:2' O-ribose methyltransferase [Puccinia graminis f. sp. tritici]|uniref:rRNA methyltransferase 2, mitochondrial n=1 Tax=Puccinia graminis f. sp. tritici TaxID=56615 RepID=A0A5B0Q368_PUCGR|nr:2' O-ribose methyltransferase [Puccinia graminis f. sp. tritici]
MAKKLTTFGSDSLRAMSRTQGSCRRFSIVRLGGEQGGQSKQFLRRAETDPYGKTKSRARGEPTYVARSAHKLIQLDQQFRIFPTPARSSPRTGFRVLDLGAAPGGWSEVVLERLAHLHSHPAISSSPSPSAPSETPPSNRNLLARSSVNHSHRLVACDLLPLHPSIAPKVSKNVDFHAIQGDFMDAQVRAKIVELLFDSTAVAHDHDNQGPVPEESRQEKETSDRRRTTTIILSDMLHSMTGIPTRDSQNSLDLSVTVADLARDLIPPNPGGSRASDTLILKHLQSEFTHQFRDRLLAEWSLVKWVKPLASRSESREGYFVTRGRRKQWIVE